MRPADPASSAPSAGCRAVLAAALLLAVGAGSAAADTLELSDGRVVEGSVEETAEGYRVRNRFGESTLTKAEVKTWSKGRTVDDLVRERLKTLPAGDAENRARLARWLVDLGRAEEGRALAEAALAVDAENATAHGVLGHERHGGRWMTPDEAMRAKGLELHGGKWMTPEEWKNVGEAAKKAAQDADEKALRRRQADEVSRLVKLMASPDTATRARSKKRLEDLATETGSDKLRTLASQVEQYVATADELDRAAAGGAEGFVLSELRVTLSKLKRPITTFETTLGSNIAGAPVRIQLPELEVINLRTMVGLPAVVAK
jgi:hypothetical protein